MTDSNTYEAKFISGDPVFVDYTPSGAAVSAGEIVVMGHSVGIAHMDIADGVLGSVAVGGGIYRVVPDAAIADGQPVWFDASGNEVTETATSNNHFGTTVGASYSSDGYVNVKHEPQGVTGAIV